MPSLLQVAVTVPGGWALGEGTEDLRALTQWSCSQSRVACMISWGLASELSPEDIHQDPPYAGAALGCEDGTLYFFESTFELKSEPPSSVPSKQNSLRAAHNRSRPSSPFLRSSAHSARSASPASTTSSLAPFTLASRSRIVSGVSKEQAMAPKNFVDFDEEPGKLKGILKGSGLRDKTMMDGLIPHFHQDVVLEGKREAPHQQERERPSVIGSHLSSSSVNTRQEAKSLLSATNSPALSIQTLSPPDSPPALPPAPRSARGMTLRAHALLDRSGEGYSLRALDLLDDQHLLVLQQDGGLSVLDIRDGSCMTSSRTKDGSLRRPLRATQSPSGRKSDWRYMQVLNTHESTFILTSAEPDRSDPFTSAAAADSSEDNDSEQIIVRLSEYVLDNRSPGTHCINGICEWTVNASSAHGVHLTAVSDESFIFSFVNKALHFITQKLDLRQSRLVVSDTSSIRSGHDVPNNLLSISNPFKALKTRSVDTLPLSPPETVNDDPGSADLQLGQDLDIGEIIPDHPICGVRLYGAEGRLRGVAWSANVLTAFDFDGDALIRSSTALSSTPASARWINASCFALFYEDHIEVHELELAVNGPEGASLGNARHHILQSIPVGRSESSDFISSSELLSTRVGKHGRRKIEYLNVFAATGKSLPANPRLVWKAAHPSSDGDTWTSDTDKEFHARVSATLPLDLDLIILGYSDGYIRRSSLPTLSQDSGATKATSDIPLDGFITSLHLVENARTGERTIVGGADDGSLALWSLQSLKLRARWTLFTTPLVKVINVNGQNAGRLRGCILCVSQDGTMAVVAIDDFQFLYVVPGSLTALRRICLGADNMFLIYADEGARLWDVKTREFRRSTTTDKAEELLQQGPWEEWSMDGEPHLLNPIVQSVPNPSNIIDVSSSIALDVEALIRQVAPTNAKSASSEDKQRNTLALGMIRDVLAVCLTRGLNEDIDRICKEKLGIPFTTASLGTIRNGAACLFSQDMTFRAWQISPEASAQRAVAIVSLLRALTTLSTQLAEDANTVTLFYVSSLPQSVGVGFQSPDLALLSRLWLESSSELRQAVRVLFDAGLARQSDEETIALADNWQRYLPSSQPGDGRESPPAATALFLCGYVAATKYNLLSTGALTDVSKSIALYLHDEDSAYRTLAIDLCSHGFGTWQHYVDAMKLLRALFTMATNSRKDSISTQNVGSQARLAVVYIATNNTPLFMSTLSLEILQPQSLEDRRSVMQLVAFLVRKKPLVIYSGLPRLIEAVVKSLDPNATGNRDVVLDAATEILGHVVQTFPTVDFHAASQRLAVGTSEGAVIMYDLKTATRLYVLEGHKKRPTACSFSPDGRRLVTVSVEESVALVWKVGSSFVSFFTPGAPPRQGHSGGEPFKTIPFNVGDQANMTLAATLENVRFEWPAERSVRLKIGDSTLTFST